MPHFTVVPVDGQRRGDYDNLEGLSWVDYGERAERDDSDGEGAPGWGLGGDKGGEWSGPREARAHADTWPDHAHVDAGLTFLSLRRSHQSLAPRAQTLFSWAPARPPHPSSSLASRGRGLQTWRTKEARPSGPLGAGIAASLHLWPFPVGSIAAARTPTLSPVNRLQALLASPTHLFFSASDTKTPLPSPIPVPP